jgi:sugar/nucleoside kinase (ribokinase family)
MPKTSRNMRVPRPATIADARALAARILGLDWDSEEIARYLRQQGIDKDGLEHCEEAEIRVIVADLEKDRMVNFE